ncbi:MAG: hypothetical protein ACKVRN_13350 [Pyrinomonadaceae bacterium]
MKYTYLKAAFLSLVIGIFVYSTPAQGRRSKPKPLATPPVVVTGAEIISQAGDIVEPEPTPEEKPVKPATTSAGRLKELNDRVRKLEDRKSNYDDRQKRVLMNLDILTRAEQRTESLRKQLFDMIEKENSITNRLQQIDYDIRPEVIERSIQIAGSFRPEEIREARRKSLAAERTNLQSLLTQIQNTRAGLDSNLLKAEQMVEKLRARAEKDIEDSLQEEDKTD